MESRILDIPGVILFSPNVSLSKANKTQRPFRLIDMRDGWQVWPRDFKFQNAAAAPQIIEASRVTKSVHVN